MFIEAKKLIGLPIAALETQSKVGKVSQIVVDTADGSVLGFLISGGGFFGGKKALSAIDVREWDPNGLVTNSIENIIEISEVVRIKNIVEQNFELFGLKAKTESGKNLGHIENYLIDTDTACVVKYYLKDLILGSRVFSADKVVRIEKKTIIFSDDVAEIPASGAAATA